MNRAQHHHRQMVEADQRRRRLAVWLDTYAAMTATRATTPEQQRLKEIAINRHFEEKPEGAGDSC